MKVGDVVVPARGQGTMFACGCGTYQCAIVANVDPFALVSVEGDMLWTKTIRPHDVVSLCQAAPDITERAVRRYKGSLPGE
jgi:predicted lipase